MSRTLQAPSLDTSPAKAVLTEKAAASVRLIAPLRVPSSLWTFQTCPWPIPQAPGKSAWVKTAGEFGPAARAMTVELIGMPDRKASATANSLAVEPYENPPEPPYFLSTAQLIAVLPGAVLMAYVVFWAMARTLPVPGSITAAAAPTPSLLPIGILAVSSCWAAPCIFGLSVVWMVSPPRLIASLRSFVVLPSAGCSFSQLIT